MELVITVQRILDDRGLTQKWLVKETGLRAAAISEICKNQRTTINREHLVKIAQALGIDDISQIMALRKT